MVQSRLPLLEKALLSALGSRARLLLGKRTRALQSTLWPESTCSGCPSCDSPGPQRLTCGAPLQHRLRPKPLVPLLLWLPGPVDGPEPQRIAQPLEEQARRLGGVLHGERGR